MTVPDIKIAIDGFSSTGKSTFAKSLAKKIGFNYLDSGALYRGVTLYSMESDPELVSLDSLELHFEPDGLHMGNRNVEKKIRTLAVSNLVSRISAIPHVRKFVDERLHSLSTGGRVIMDGRDIGTTVMPDAEIKIFMTADEEVRAKRRYEEMISRGDSTTLEEVRKNLASRDYADTHRETSPLSQAPDAFVLDNSGMSLDEELTWAIGLIQGKLKIFSL